MTLPPQPPTLDFPLALLVVRIGLASHRSLRRRLRSHRLTVAQVCVLYSLERHEPTHLRALARDLGISRQAVLLACRGLEADNLVREIPSPNDTRLKRIALTDSGRTCLRAADPIVARLGAQILAASRPVARPDFTRTVNRLARSPLFGRGREMRWGE